MQTRCPICYGVTTWEENVFRPFCSERCQWIDLGHWASETYRVSDQEISPESETQQEPNGQNRNR